MFGGGLYDSINLLKEMRPESLESALSEEPRTAQTYEEAMARALILGCKWAKVYPSIQNPSEVSPDSARIICEMKLKAYAEIFATVSNNMLQPELVGISKCACTNLAECNYGFCRPIQNKASRVLSGVASFFLEKVSPIFRGIGN
jgi:hypothetical protein